jgi:hypothetical protein
MAVAIGGAHPVEATDPSGQPQVEAWSGTEVFRNVWSIYAGGTYAPLGSVIREGLRVRAVAGYGGYSYPSPGSSGAFHGTVFFADLLAGHQAQFGTLTVKILGGLTVTDRDVDDPGGHTGTDWGGKIVLETWWNVTDQTWTSVDLSWTTLNDVYGVRARMGWRMTPMLSIGVEAASTGNLDYDAARLGGFVRYEWMGGEWSVSAGAAGDGPGSGAVDLQGAFATFNVLTRF